MSNMRSLHISGNEEQSLMVRTSDYTLRLEILKHLLGGSEGLHQTSTELK